MKNDRMINSLITYNVNEDVNRRVLFSDFAYNRINLFFVSQVVTAVSSGLSALGRERLDEVQLHLVRSEDDVFTSCLLNNLEIAPPIPTDPPVCFAEASQCRIIW